ncbi:MAG TPA: hypothetical protein PKO28_00530 [Bacilli bacterium]|nr:hypothetical protein [Bacilli bacterium]HPS18641.1 hypothetical protein [Bacilli bacterium]
MEEKENLNVEPFEQDPAGGMSPNDKNALVSFILALVGLFLCETFIGPIVLGIISLSLNKKSNGGNKKPFTVFAKIAKPVAIIDIILGPIALIIIIASIVAFVAAGLAA